ncbi:acyltransferase [Cupriavidus basilensis]
MSKPGKIEKIFWFGLVGILSRFNPRWATSLQYHYLDKWGVKFCGRPNFIAGDVWFDGTDYGLIELGEQVTLSSGVRILTHDWSMHTVAKSLGISSSVPLGRIVGVKIGDFSFVGMGSILMPGCQIGRGCIIGAGTVVRGRVEDYSIYVGNPGAVSGDVVDYLKKKCDPAI